MGHTRATLIGSKAAATLLGRSPQIVRHWGRTGRLIPARLRPMRWRVEDVVSFSPPPARPGTGRPRGNTQLQNVLERILTP